MKVALNEVCTRCSKGISVSATKKRNFRINPPPNLNAHIRRISLKLKVWLEYATYRFALLTYGIINKAVGRIQTIDCRYWELAVIENSRHQRNWRSNLYSS